MIILAEHNLKAALQKEEGASVTVRLPVDLYNQIGDKADTLGTDFQTAVATLLRIGLKAQAKSESEISSHVGRLLDQNASEDPETIDRIGELIFGK